MLWTAEPWTDITRATGKVPTIEKIYNLVESEGPIHYSLIAQKCNVSTATVYRCVDKLQKERRITQKGNLYEVNFGD